MKNSRIFLALLLTLAFTASAFAGGEGWSDDYAKALAQAKAEKKLVLVDFTGSDWCGWCIKMNDEVFSKPAFKDYAAKNLVLVELDYPHKKQLSDEVKAQNDKLKQQFDVHGFPTLLVVDGDGKEVSKMVGYQKGGPEEFTKKLEALKK